MVEKISIVTDEISQDLDEVTRFLNLHDVRAIEIRSIRGLRVPGIDEDLWEAFKKRIRDEVWKVVALSPGTFKEGLFDKELNDYDLVRLGRTIEMAREVGAEAVITFGFTEKKDAPIPDRAVSILRAACDSCAQFGIPLLLENEPGSLAQTGEGARALIDAVNHPDFFANWDPCNSNVLDDPESLARGARALGGKIRHVHVKDGRPRKKSEFAECGPISTGHVGWRYHLDVLKGIGYKGYLSIETHFEPLWESTETVLRELRELVAEADFWGND